MTDENETTTIAIKCALAERLKNKGKKGESWNDLLERLVFHENKKNES